MAGMGALPWGCQHQKAPQVPVEHVVPPGDGAGDDGRDGDGGRHRRGGRGNSGDGSRPRPPWPAGPIFHCWTRRWRQVIPLIFKLLESDSGNRSGKNPSVHHIFHHMMECNHFYKTVYDPSQTYDSFKPYYSQATVESGRWERNPTNRRNPSVHPGTFSTYPCSAVTEGSHRIWHHCKL